MKISCTKKEFAELVKACYENSTGHTKCDYCLFYDNCAKGYAETKEEIMSGIEDICEIVPGDDVDNG